MQIAVVTGGNSGVGFATVRENNPSTRHACMSTTCVIIYPGKEIGSHGSNRGHRVPQSNEVHGILSQNQHSTIEDGKHFSYTWLDRLRLPWLGDITTVMSSPGSLPATPQAAAGQASPDEGDGIVEAMQLDLSSFEVIPCLG